MGNRFLYDGVSDERRHGTNWRQVRGRITPCRSCIFHALCSNLSNYNIVIGKNNLCHIR
ncbi:MAG: hypothetical protein ACM3SY_11065 [Candidatus Omnitrophota bacterium]